MFEGAGHENRRPKSPWVQIPPSPLPRKTKGRKMKRLIPSVLIFALLFVSSTSQAAWRCKVVKVADGDTVTAWCKGQKVRIRLARIDAPEKSQPYGLASKRLLENMVAHKNVTIIPNVRDRYGRVVAEIECNGRNINQELVRNGAAWVYRRYSRDPSLLRLEAAARAARRGLWNQGSPMPPWKWRRRR